MSNDEVVRRPAKYAFEEHDECSIALERSTERRARMFSQHPHGIALVGAGRWGSKLARNIALVPDTQLVWVHDLDPAASGSVAGLAGARVARSLDQVLGDTRVEAVVIASPASTHGPLVRECLTRGLHVLVEKPLAMSVGAASELSSLAVAHGRILMVDHTYLFSAAADTVRQLIADAELGTIREVRSTRFNTDAFRSDIDVFWDLAHHDLAIVGYLIPGLTPTAVSAAGVDEFDTGHASAGTLRVEFADGLRLCVEAQWTGPAKRRRIEFIGSRAALVWDDLATNGRLTCRDARTTRVIPLEERHEPLRGVVREFVAAIEDRVEPSSDANAEVRILSILEAVDPCLRQVGDAAFPPAVPA